MRDESQNSVFMSVLAQLIFYCSLYFCLLNTYDPEWATLILLVTSFGLLVSAHKTRVKAQVNCAYLPLVCGFFVMLLGSLFNRYDELSLLGCFIISILYLVSHQLFPKTAIMLKDKTVNGLAIVSSISILAYAYFFASVSLNAHAFIIFALSLNILFILFKKQFNKNYMTGIIILNLLLMQLNISRFWHVQSDNMQFFLIALLANFAVIPMALFVKSEKDLDVAFNCCSIPLAVAQIAYLSAHTNLGIDPYISAFWAMTAIVFFAAGLIIKHKSLRVSGLILLGLCIVRVFVNDIHETLYRIIAFTVVAIILMIVAYLYSLTRKKPQESGSTK